MSSSAQHKAYPLSMRLPAADIAVIDRAASLRGHSRTQFVRDAAVRAAEEVVLETALVRMSPEGFQEFMGVIAAAAETVPAIVEIMKREAPWEREPGDAD